MTNEEWSWLLGALSVLGLALLTRKRWEGWLVTLGTEVLWAAYSIVTHQLGFLVSTVAYTAAAAYGLYEWKVSGK